MKSSHRTLKIVAALIWLSGGLILLLKGGQLALQAFRLHPELSWPWLALALGIILGGLKAKYALRKACRKNLERIYVLQQPRIWQCYRRRFFFFLFLMISFGAMLSRLAQADYPMLVGVACLDFSVAMALLGSWPVFWKEYRADHQQNNCNSNP
ncbi:MAG: hypothetical protein IMY82_02185 [Chloroflexi bacterium]|nr:hypothetical protein [Chloroflexota bacterium]